MQFSPESSVVYFSPQMIYISVLNPHVFLSLFREQQTRKDLNIVTGFQLLDGKHHLFILEGLRDQAVKHIWESITKPKEGIIMNHIVSLWHIEWGIQWCYILVIPECLCVSIGGRDTHLIHISSFWKESSNHNPLFWSIWGTSQPQICTEVEYIYCQSSDLDIDAFISFLELSARYIWYHWSCNQK